MDTLDICFLYTTTINNYTTGIQQIDPFVIYSFVYVYITFLRRGSKADRLQLLISSLPKATGRLAYISQNKQVSLIDIFEDQVVWSIQPVTLFTSIKIGNSTILVREERRRRKLSILTINRITAVKTEKPTHANQEEED